MHTQYDADDVARVTASLVDRIAATFDPARPLGIIGIRTRGEVLAQRLTRALKDKGFSQIQRGTLDITLYRDDLSEIGPKPLVRPTAVPFDLDGLPILLVDDVLFTGRSIRAALSALSDFGRPAIIRLLVLADRGGRELPIQADFVGLTLKDVPRDYRVNVRLKETDHTDEITVEPRA
ncbi:MAG TPA: bifunctional pyr operon transcriptional regulator/uracil phosphoribosyltransferase PyrR [Tepidisphaeraceae bacterium]|jgi:pyrimidine operon attenuation protein/uracil phosphoribosyltransferase